MLREKAVATHQIFTSVNKILSFFCVTKVPFKVYTDLVRITRLSGFVPFGVILNTTTKRKEKPMTKLILKYHKGKPTLWGKGLQGMLFLFCLGVGICISSRAEESKAPAENQKGLQFSTQEVNAHRLGGWAPVEGPDGGTITSVSFTSSGEMLAQIKDKSHKTIIGRYNGKSWSFIDSVTNPI